MRFLHPSYFHLAWLAVIPLILYLFRRKAKRVPVSTLLFYRSLAREHQESAWLRKIKRWLSLALTLLVLTLGVLALTRPTADADGETPGSLVIVLDRSASMAAKDSRGRTRIDEAKALIRDRVRALPDSVIVSLIVFDTKPNALLSRSLNRRELLRSLEAVKSTPREGRIDGALTVARRLAGLDKPSEIWQVSDRPAANLAAGGDLRMIERHASVALRKCTNVGITAFQIRKAPLARGRYEGFVKLAAATMNSGRTSTTLEVRIAARLAQIREVELKPGESASLILPLEGVRGQLLEVEAKTAGDCLGWDDKVLAPLPEQRPLVVAWFSGSPDPFTGIALGSLVEAGALDILKGDPKNWPPKDRPDIYVFEHWVPDPWPTDRPAIVLNPQESTGPLRVHPLGGRGVPHESVRIVAPDHPVCFRISGSRLSITQTCALDVANVLEPLWVAGQDAVLAAGDIGGQRIVVSAVSPSTSEQLALLPAFPLMLGNAIYWCGEQSNPMREIKSLHPGDWLAASGLVKWTEWDGKQTIVTSDEAADGALEIHRIGAWESSDGKMGSSILASQDETDVPMQSTLPSTPVADPAAQTWTQTGRNWPRTLMWALLVVLVVESFLFHRRAVY